MSSNICPKLALKLLCLFSLFSFFWSSSLKLSAFTRSLFLSLSGSHFAAREINVSQLGGLRRWRERERQISVCSDDDFCLLAVMLLLYICLCLPVFLLACLPLLPSFSLSLPSMLNDDRFAQFNQLADFEESERAEEADFRLLRSWESEWTAAAEH